jgi:hypothetical protein
MCPLIWIIYTYLVPIFRLALLYSRIYKCSCWRAALITGLVLWTSFLFLPGRHVWPCTNEHRNNYPSAWEVYLGLFVVRLALQRNFSYTYRYYTTGWSMISKQLNYSLLRAGCIAALNMFFARSSWIIVRDNLILICFRPQCPLFTRNSNWNISNII